MVVMNTAVSSGKVKWKFPVTSPRFSEPREAPGLGGNGRSA